MPNSGMDAPPATPCFGCMKGLRKVRLYPFDSSWQPQGLFWLCQRMWFGALLDDSDALLFDLNEPFEPEVPQRLAQI
jgi:hypothetical protein